MTLRYTYRGVLLEVLRTRTVTVRVIPVRVLSAPGSLSEPFQTYLEDVPVKFSGAELCKAAVLGTLIIVMYILTEHSF
jgi:hypothetical protein